MSGEWEGEGEQGKGLSISCNMIRTGKLWLLCDLVSVIWRSWADAVFCAVFVMCSSRWGSKAMPAERLGGCDVLRCVKSS